jgi:ligand-binding SRPBCC domain-containing protein
LKLIIKYKSSFQGMVHQQKTVDAPVEDFWKWKTRSDRILFNTGNIKPYQRQAKKKTRKLTCSRML